MLREHAAILAVGREHRLRVEAPQGKHLEQRRRAVSLAQDEAIAVRVRRVGRIYPEGVEIRRYEDVDAGKA